MDALRTTTSRIALLAVLVVASTATVRLLTPTPHSHVCRYPIPMAAYEVLPSMRIPDDSELLVLTPRGPSETEKMYRRDRARENATFPMYAQHRSLTTVFK